jgi:Uma2 family endonuclease
MGKSVARVTKPEVIPPLRDGDRLSGPEFLRRYEADRTVGRAELIGGVVYINARRRPDGTEEHMPPIANEGHARPQFNLIGFLGIYALHTPGVEGSGPATVIVSDEALPEPDALMRILPECGGRCTPTADDYLEGPPELLVEVANTSVHRDMGPKYRDYQDGGVLEYLVWRTADRRFHLFTLARGRYRPVPPTDEGVLRSVAFPGLWLDTAALLAGDLRKALDTLQLGIASPEHAAFVAKLAAAKGKKKKR